MTAPLASPAASQEPVKIGMLVEQTGAFSWYGEETLNGARLFVKQLNAKGGINGRPVELVVYNNESVPEKANTGARRLIQQDKVVAIVGLGLPGNGQAVAPLVQKGPPTYSLSGAYAPQHRMMFGGTVFVGDTQKRALRFLAQKNLKRVALLTTNDASGQLAEKSITGHAGVEGVNLVGVEFFNPTDLDVTPQLNRIMANKPDAIVAWLVGKPLGVVMKGVNQLGISLPLVTSHGNLTPGFLASIAPLQRGPLYVFGTKDLIWRGIADGDPQKKLIVQMQEAHQAEFGKEGGVGTGTGYDALLILTTAIEKAGSTEPDAIVTAIENLKNFVGVVGVYNFSPDDHRGLNAVAAIPMLIEHGKLQAAP